MHQPVVSALILGAIMVAFGHAGNFPADFLAVPKVGEHHLRVLSPTVLELSLVTTKERSSSQPALWNFVDASGELHLPPAAEFVVTAGERTLGVQEVGFRRRVVYAPLARRDLRIGNSLYLRLTEPVRENEDVEVKSTNRELWPEQMRFVARAEPLRFSPAIHVNQLGYLPEYPKQAMIGLFLGSAGELEVPVASGFQLINARSGEVVSSGVLTSRTDKGFSVQPPPYQKILEADFSEFKTPGEYRLSVPGLGASYSFVINDGVAAAMARTYALGLYHQRCGTSNTFPFTRFVHGPCHTAPATIPGPSLLKAEYFLADSSSDCTNNPRHCAPPLTGFAASLYPFVKSGSVDVSGGHHDAGDYSKYTINSAGLIHALVFSADAFPDAGALDNLGLPESGDGKSDLLQEAKWEADFLAKMQDADGGFYFLVYPRNRRYENDVLPDRGDAQIVWPKNTAATAAAVAALAQTASSPLFKKQFPEAAAQYLEKARAGWAFLTTALTKYGRDGAYQKLTHYGDEFMHDDELAWAACELFLATGDDAFQRELINSFQPSNPDSRRWGWWRMYESYGRAIRSYALAAKTGRIPRGRLSADFLRACETEMLNCAEDQLRWANESAYGTSFPSETKRFGGGGWYFSMDQAFDLAAACALDHPAANDPRPEFVRAILSNLNYEAGCNPVNVSYLPGVGWKRPREIVHHYAQNDRRVLPPTGIPQGNIQAAFMWLDNYKDDLRTLSFPRDDTKTNAYPIYDRWADSFNVQAEFVVVNQARALGTAALLMSLTSLKPQEWKPQPASIAIETASNGRDERIYTARLNETSLTNEPVQILWEAQAQDPAFGKTFSYTPSRGTTWVEVEALWPDGRRVFATTNLVTRRGE